MARIPPESNSEDTLEWHKERHFCLACEQVSYPDILHKYDNLQPLETTSGSVP